METVGLKLVTHHPVIEPVSAPEPGTEICAAETEAKMPRLCQLRLNPETRKVSKKPPFQRNGCGQGERSSSPEIGWWARQGSNL